MGHLISVTIVMLFITVTAMMFVTQSPGPSEFALRFTGLWGFVFMAIAAIMVPYLKGIKTHFGLTSIKVHYIFSYLGLGLTFIHSILPAISRADIKALLPDFSSWSDFWSLGGGEIAFMLMVIAFAGILLKPKFKSWRIIHCLMYPMLLLSLVHATMVGTSFKSIFILIACYGLFALVVLAFVLKRIRLYSVKKSRNSAVQGSDD